MGRTDWGDRRKRETATRWPEKPADEEIEVAGKGELVVNAL